LVRALTYELFEVLLTGCIDMKFTSFPHQHLKTLISITAIFIPETKKTL